MGCSKGTTEPKVLDEMKMREIAWNSMENAEKKTVIGDWKQAKITLAKWDNIGIKEAKVKPESIAQILFKTSFDPLIGSIGIYIDTDANKIVGYDIRM
jgi:hypothetical protein